MIFIRSVRDRFPVEIRVVSAEFDNGDIAHALVKPRDVFFDYSFIQKPFKRLPVPRTIIYFNAFPVFEQSYRVILYNFYLSAVGETEAAADAVNAALAKAAAEMMKV